MNNKVYISGAISHYDISERKAAFAAASKKLSLRGFKPVNPFENGLPQPGDWREHRRVDISMLLQCKYIYMLKGWWVSKGAKLELDVATSCGIIPMFETGNTSSKEQKCCICGKTFYGYGNDPYPLKEEGECCESCQWEKVLPERYNKLSKEREQV